MTINWKETATLREAAQLLHPHLKDLLNTKPGQMRGWLLSKPHGWQNVQGTAATWDTIAPIALAILPTDARWNWVRGRIRSIAGYQIFMSVYRGVCEDEHDKIRLNAP